MITTTPTERYWAYVEDVLSGAQVAPRRVIRSCERTLALKDDPEVYLDTDELTAFVELAESFKIADSHTLHGEHVQLMPWQVWVLGGFIAWKWKADDGVLYKINFTEVARGAGKSAVAALLAIHWAVSHDGLQISILSGKQDQAALILDSVKSFLGSVDDHGIDYLANKYEVKINNSTVRALSAKTHTLDGLRGKFLIDEFHEVRDNLWGKISSALPKGRDYQVISVGTPGGVDLGLESNYYQARVIAEDCLRDFTKLKTVQSCLWGIDEEDDVSDSSIWQKGQPGLGHVVSMLDYERAWESAVAQNREGEFERYQACRYSLRSVGWLEADVIDAASEDLDIMDFKGEKCYIGLDLSKSFDLSSMALVFVRKQHFYTFMYHWVPAQGARRQYRAHAQKLDQWNKRDFVTIVETDTIDYDMIRDRLLWACENFDVPKEGIGTDALGGLKPVLQSWENDHQLPLVGIPQTITVIGPATFSFESLIREGSMTIRTDPVFEHAASCVVLQVGNNGDRRPTKEKSTGVIDPVIAGLQAVAVAIEHGAMTPPAYSTNEDIIF